MSLGTTFKIDAHGGQNRPMIFWQQQELARQKKKKFSYKEREMKHPLRSKKQPVIEDAPSKVKARGPADNRKPLNNKASNQKRKGGHEERTPHPNTGTVVLTQKEFDSILETIGKLSVEKDNLYTDDHVKTDPIGQVASPREYLDLPLDKSISLDQPESDQRPTYPNGGQSNLSPQQNISLLDNAPNQALGTSPARNVIAPPPPHTTAHVVPPLPLTKAEKKRLQWQQERAEQQKIETQAGSPWGRPGAGAPIKDAQGNAINDYQVRKDEPTHTSPTNDKTSHYNAVEHPPPPQTFLASNIFNGPPPPQSAAPVSMATSPPVAAHTHFPPAPAPQLKDAPPPAAIRSSFAIGVAEPDEGRYNSGKDRQKQQWLQELEAQREEQRQRKLSEKSQRMQAAMTETWADKFAVPYSPAHLPDQPTNLDGVADTGTTQGRVSSAPQAQGFQMTHTSPVPDTFIRGQNVPLDPEQMKQQQEKRQRHLAYQEEIRQQIEEKERRRHEERNKKLMEEQAEDSRLRAERDQLKQQLTTEQRSTRDKQEAEQRRVETLKTALDEAAEAAQRDKHARRLQRLQRAGHDVSHLDANFQAKMTPRPETQAELAYKTPRDVPHVEPSYIPGLDPTPRGVPAYDASPRVPNHAPDHHSQYEPPPPEVAPISRESTADIEYSGPLHQISNKNIKKQVRVHSAPKNSKVGKTQTKPAAREPQLKEPQPKVGQRPRWGYTKPPKRKAVKQSEKDPFYEKNKERMEAQRFQRQQELLEMAERNAPRLKETAAVRNRSRSRDRAGDAVLPSKLDNRRIAENNLPPKVPSIGHHVREPSPNYDAYARTDVSHRSRADIPRNRSRGPYSQTQQVVSHHSLSPPLTLRDAGRLPSPPIPALKHRDQHGDAPRDLSRADITSRLTHYTEEGPVRAPVQKGDFVPFIRSSNVLDPARAAEPMPVSREPTQMERARHAYHQEQNPAKYGHQMELYQDKPIRAHHGKDPILDPSLVTDHPTVRQDRILQQLSSLRKGLMQKQREYSVMADMQDPAETPDE